GKLTGLGSPAARRSVPLGRARHTAKINASRAAHGARPSRGRRDPVGRVHGVPDHAEPPMGPETADTSPANMNSPFPPVRPRRPVQAVLFDFQGTLAQVTNPVDQVLAAAQECGVTLERARATVLAARLVTAGLPGGPPPARVPPHLAEVWADR